MLDLLRGETGDECLHLQSGEHMFETLIWISRGKGWVDGYPHMATGLDCMQDVKGYQVGVVEGWKSITKVDQIFGSNVARSTCWGGGH